MIMRLGMVFAIPLTLAAACSNSNDSQDVIEIANRYVAENLGTTVADLRATVHDEGAAWRVTYELPEGYVGGTPIIYVDKRTRQVTNARSYQ